MCQFVDSDQLGNLRYSGIMEKEVDVISVVYSIPPAPDPINGGSTTVI
jgi:hypothetical protein